MKNTKKNIKVMSKPVEVKFKTKSGKTVIFKAIATSLKHEKEKRPQTTRRKKS